MPLRHSTSSSEMAFVSMMTRSMETAVLTSVLGFSADPWTTPANGTPRAVLEGM